jgi:uncharacterized phiE125 gp8 family phage protein
MAISLATVKTALKIDYSDDDAELTRLISVAISWVETYCGFKLTSASRTMYLGDWRRTVLAVQPVTSITSVVYTDTADDAQTVDAEDYWLDRTGDLVALEFLDTFERKDGTLITVTYLAGYSTEPNEAVQAVISLVGLWYNNPEAAQPVGLATVPMGAQFMLEHLRIRAPFS